MSGRRRVASAAIGTLLLLLTLDACVPSPSPSPPHPTTRATRATGYFVDCGAGAPGDGSRGAPWTSLEQVSAHGVFSAGERILLKRGSVCIGRLAPTGSGTNGRPIVLGAYGTGARPVVHGGATPDQTGTVQLTDQHDWVVQDLDVTNVDPLGPDNTMRAGILAVNESGGTLRGLVIRRNLVRAVTSSPGSSSADPHSYGGIAAVVRGAAKTGDGAFDGLRIEDNTVDHVGRSGISVWSDGSGPTRVTNTSITGNAVRYAEGDSIVVWGLDGAVIDHNTSEHGGLLPACPRCSSTAVNTANAGIWPVASTHVLVRYNEVWGEAAAGGDGEGFDIDDLTSDVVLEGNYAHDNDGGGVLICGAADAVVRYNVFEHDRQSEIAFSCPQQRSGVRILNNTFVLGPTLGAAVVRHTNTTGSDTISFTNNLVLNPSGGGYDWPAPVSASHNAFVGARSPSEPPDAAALRSDALLQQPGAGATGLDTALAYTPVAGSPLIGSGEELGGAAGAAPVDAGLVDYAGRAVRAAAPDRGALGSDRAAELPSAAAPVAAARTGLDVVLSWPGSHASAWQVLRSGEDGRFVPISGQLLSTEYSDIDPPRGPARYRIDAVDRDGTRVVGTASAP